MPENATETLPASQTDISLTSQQAETSAHAHVKIHNAQNISDTLLWSAHAIGALLIIVGMVLIMAQRVKPSSLTHKD